MRMHFSAAAAGLLLLAGIGAAAADTVVIAPEQETVIREYVKKQPLASVKLPGVELNVGTALPDTVELYEVPDVKYRYTVIDNRTVVVDPDTRTVIKITNKIDVPIEDPPADKEWRVFNTSRRPGPPSLSPAANIQRSANEPECPT
ncbi:MAG: DUF1236 domain-containing protein [Mesorhizobium sp.]|nr:MAG: DUF1236 domain-containing protein [Mesorhizobium sp.]